MSKILVIKTSTSGENSTSNKLVDAIVKKLKSDGKVEALKVCDLSKEPLPHLGGATIAAYFTPAESRDETLINASKLSEKAIDDLNETDIIVIGIPMYNFGIPSSLKAWIDHIARVGATFYFDENGMPHGMVHNKKVILAIASGAVYSDGMMKPYDFIEPYMRAILGYLGIYDISVVRSEGSSIPGLQETSMAKGLDMVASLSF